MPIAFMSSSKAPIKEGINIPSSAVDLNIVTNVKNVRIKILLIVLIFVFDKDNEIVKFAV